MSRLMSVAFTEQAVLERRKTVTRRAGWRHAVAGQELTLCRKVMGRRKGEPLVRLVQVELVDVRREPLGRLLDDPGYGAAEMIREGFPFMNPAEFIEKYFTAAQRLTATDEVARLEWRYLDSEGR